MTIPSILDTETEILRMKREAAARRPPPLTTPPRVMAALLLGFDPRPGELSDRAVHTDDAGAPQMTVTLRAGLPLAPSQADPQQETGRERRDCFAVLAESSTERRPTDGTAAVRRCSKEIQGSGVVGTMTPVAPGLPNAARAVATPEHFTTFQSSGAVEIGRAGCRTAKSPERATAPDLLHAYHLLAWSEAIEHGERRSFEGWLDES